MKLFGREPAQWLAVLAIAIQLAAGWGLPLSEGQQAAINAAATAVMGFVLAWAVSKEKAAAAAGGVIGALGQLAVSLGVEVSQERIAMTGAAITALLAFWLYGKVTAPVDANMERVPKVKVISGRVER
ncbi:hypothetical protein [Actinomadura sp. GTD37]|uniref:hypothetical protein n=1 Tax=Actinomadura sp. GTD37 TaxID=1778030 RepID=UPI0035C1C0E4